MKRKDNQLLKYIIWSMIIGIANLFTFEDKTGALMLVGAEVIILLFLLIRQKYDDFYVHFLIFLCMSFEFNQSTGSDELYGFKAFEIAGINIAIIILIIFIIFYFVVNNIFHFRRNHYDVRFLVIVMFMGGMGVLNGGICLGLNDNSVINLGNVGGLFFGQVYAKFIMVIAFALGAYVAIHNSEESINKIKNCLVAILVGAICTMIVSRFAGILGRYGGVDTLQIQNVVRYTPFLYVYAFSEGKNKHKILVFIMATIGTILTLMYNATGKMILLYILMPIAAVIVTYKKNKKLAVCEALLLPIVCVCLFSIGFAKFEESVLFSAKMRDVVSLFKFGGGWLRDMPLSPRTRVAEFINICIEYKNKPIFFLLGKGYLGSIKDYLGMITNVLDGYTEEENITGSFYWMHESLNNLFLSNGILGIAFVVRYGLLLLKGITKSMHFYSALFWLMFSYGFSVTLSGYGITALMICLFELSIENEKSMA